jgi:large subunit ribosomal protein L4
MALKVALTDRAVKAAVFIVESFDFNTPNTKGAIELLGKIAPEKGRKLVVTDGHHLPTVKSFTNIPDVMTDRADSLHAYEILKSSYVVLTQDALNKVEEVFSS